MKRSRMQSMKMAVLVISAALFSVNAFAHDGDHDDQGHHRGHQGKDVGTYMDNCDTLPLVNKLVGGPDNTSVCVDAPVSLKKAKVVFNLDKTVTDGGGRPIGLRHMWMLGTALKARINAGLVDPEDVSIIGVFHGGGSAWALNTNSDVVKDFIEKIFALKKQGVNISLEMCGVTMLGHGWTNDDLYSSDNGMIHVNQGAIGRIIDLEQHGYAYLQEG